MTSGASDARQLDAIAEEFWTWRDATGLWTGDDIPRIDREPDWTPSISLEDVADNKRALAVFRDRFEALDPAGFDGEAEVHFWLFHSALSRSEWELSVMRPLQHDAVTLALQAIGPYYDLLLRPAPFPMERQRGIIEVLSKVPAQLAIARQNLEGRGVRVFAEAAMRQLASVEPQLAQSAESLAAEFDPSLRDELGANAAIAGDALGEFRDWLSERIGSFGVIEPVGTDRFTWYLHNVALLPESVERIEVIAAREADRSIVWEGVEELRAASSADGERFHSAKEQVAQQHRDARAVRSFYEERHLLSQPERLRDYLTAPIPPYVEPIRWIAVSDDLTGPERLDQNGVSYTPEPTDSMGYFDTANAVDPRLGIIHEGAHYQQLALSWAHTDPWRRRYYNSIPNEGIAFYNEELMMNAGLFADAPRSRVFVRNFSRLRSLRVLADIGLVTGSMSLDDAVSFFAENVPMDTETAFLETTMYLGNPGLALSYLVGKTELLRFAGDAVRRRTETLRAVHDWVWLNGNLPFSLQRLEFLDDRTDIDLVRERRAPLSSIPDRVFESGEHS